MVTTTARSPSAARAESAGRAAGDAASVEVLDGETGTPAGVALALSAMTFAIGRRVILVDGVERWKQAEVEQHLAPRDGGDAARDNGRDVRA